MKLYDHSNELAFYIENFTFNHSYISLVYLIAIDVSYKFANHKRYKLLNKKFIKVCI